MLASGEELGKWDADTGGFALIKTIPEIKHSSG
jgi:hypothetical protein